MSDQRRWSIAPYFIVDDVLATANFYRDKLGFHYQRLWGEPPCFTIVQRNGAHLMLRQLESPGQMRPNPSPSDPDDFTWNAYLWIDDADALYAEFRDPNYAAVPLLRRMVSAELLGRKSGQGFLDYRK